jgi:gliding motility-associated-like protein
LKNFLLHVSENRLNNFVLIFVNDLTIPTLITPNMDGINDYFVIAGLPNLGKSELQIFDSGGFLVFRTASYDNLWNGIDTKGNLLPGGIY